MAGESERVELVYRATAGEFREALSASARASDVGRWGRRLLVASGWLGALVATVPLALGGAPDPKVLVMLGVCVLGLLILPWLQARHCHRRAAARGEHRTVLDWWGVTVVTDRGTDRMARWSEMTRYAETRRAFVLLDAHAYAPLPLLLPKRGTADVDGLRALLDDRLERFG